MINQLYIEHGRLVDLQCADSLDEWGAARLRRVRRQLHRWQAIRRRIWILVKT